MPSMRQATIETDERSYVILLQPEPEGGYTVTCPALPGLVTYGETLEQARAKAADAISGYFACLREDGEADPWKSREGMSDPGSYDDDRGRMR
jgi:antitoxin HicB